MRHVRIAERDNDCRSESARIVRLRGNRQFFNTLCHVKDMEGRGLVLTTTSQNRRDEVVGADSTAIEIVGRPPWT
jgi:hypothetical protein